MKSIRGIVLALWGMALAISGCASLTNPPPSWGPTPNCIQDPTNPACPPPWQPIPIEPNAKRSDGGTE